MSNLSSLAPDLANGAYPRSPRTVLGGYVVAARTLDKCRAVLAGTNGEYHFDCPLDNFFELQEFLEGYIPQFIPAGKIVRVWFDVYDIEEERI